MDEKVLKDTNDNLEQKTIIALRKLYLKYGNVPIHWSTYYDAVVYLGGMTCWNEVHDIALEYVNTIPYTENSLRIEYVRIKQEVMDDQ